MQYSLPELKQIMKDNKLKGWTILTEQVNKIALSGDDDKRVVQDDCIHTLAYGHYRLKKITIKMNVNVEGVVLPNSPLSNFQLLDAEKKLKIKNFRGVFVRDELPKGPRKVECGILNLCDSQGSGTHWTAWIKNGKGKLYFDSYGLAPPVEYLKNPVYYNNERIQPDGVVICGHLCLYVLKKLSDGCNFQDVINNLY